MEREGQIQCKTASKKNLNIADMSNLNLVESEQGKKTKLII